MQTILGSTFQENQGKRDERFADDEAYEDDEDGEEGEEGENGDDDGLPVMKRWKMSDGLGQKRLD